MTRCVGLYACIFLASHSALAADPHWIRMQSPNFEVFATAGERSARETLQHFEQVRDFFGQFVHDRTDRPPVVRIVVFSSLKEFEPYRFNEVAVAYYKATA